MSRSWLRLRSKQMFYRALAAVYGFDGWHYRVVRENCGYFGQLSRLHTQLLPAATVEVGCGLGEILAGLECRVRIGIDRDPAVIKAAAFLRGRSVTFLVADEIRPIRIPETGAVCLVCVNWLHAYAPAEAQELLGRYVAATRATYVIFDIIDTSVANYKFHHPADLLARSGKLVRVADGGDGIRRLVVVDTRG
jgi:SAM-dependent methyltransferase